MLLPQEDGRRTGFDAARPHDVDAGSERRDFGEPRPERRASRSRREERRRRRRERDEQSRRQAAGE